VLRGHQASEGRSGERAGRRIGGDVGRARRPGAFEEFGHDAPVSHSETCGRGVPGCDAGVEPTILTQFAQTAAGLGALGLATAGLNLIALRVVRVDEVPVGCQARIRWWSTHNPAFLVVTAVVTALGLAVLAVSR
jgi:hypothetical protein